MAKDKPGKVETPMLTRYLMGANPNPSYAVNWPDWGGWAVFAVCLMIPIAGCVVGIIAGSLSGTIVRSFRKPRTDAERLEEQTCTTIRQLRRSLTDTFFLAGHLPSDVIAALETTATAFHAAKLRLPEDPVAAANYMNSLQNCMGAAMRAVEPVVRRDNQSKREWMALKNNRQVTGIVVDTLMRQAHRMEYEVGLDRERLAAIRELESELGPLPTHTEV